MKLKAVAFTLGLCAAGMLVLPDGALAFRGGVHRGGFHGGRAWHGGGGHWAGGGRHWAGGRGWHGGYWRAVDTMLEDGAGAQQRPGLRLEQQPLVLQRTDRPAISCRTSGMVMHMCSNM